MEKLIFFLVLVVGVFAIIQIISVYELVNRIKGGKTEHEITHKENIFNANFWIFMSLVYFSCIGWMSYKYGMNAGLGPAQSVHGQEVDFLLRLNWWVILPTFFLTSSILAAFIRIYIYNPDRKALHFSHSNVLEFVWTITPTIVLAIIIIMGLTTWQSIMNPADEGEIVEIYAQQFNWTARYSGTDNILGKADYKMITGNNPLGVITTKNIEGSYEYLDGKIKLVQEKLDKEGAYLPDAKVGELKDKLERLMRQKNRIKEGIEKITKPRWDKIANNDVIARELHLVKGKTYTFRFRSKDIIHSAWFPYFRAQMNCVPGMMTHFTLTPISTTKEMRKAEFIQKHFKELEKYHNERKRALGEEEEKVEFDFILLCNKICGASHYNMQMKIVVETQEEFDLWMSKQKQIDGNFPKISSSSK